MEAREGRGLLGWLGGWVVVFLFFFGWVAVGWTGWVGGWVGVGEKKNRRFAATMEDNYWPASVSTRRMWLREVDPRP